jgi:hypothetical protein
MLTSLKAIVIPELAITITQWLHQELKDFNENDFVPRTGLKFVFSLNLAATSLIFAGPSLTAKKEWLDAFLGIQSKIAAVIIWMTPMPQVLRSLFGPFLPPVKELKAHQEKIRSFLFPVEGRLENFNIPTILDHYIATSKTVDEQDITAKFCVLSTSAVSFLEGSSTCKHADGCRYIP